MVDMGNTYAKLAAAGIAALLALAPPGAALADDSWGDPDWVLEQEGRFGGCVLVSAEGNGYVVDQYRRYDGPNYLAIMASPNVGTTAVGFLACLPVVCPDSMTRISTACHADDPLAHVPDYGHHPTTIANTSPSDLPTIDVAPLVEPAIAAVAS